MRATPTFIRDQTFKQNSAHGSFSLVAFSARTSRKKRANLFNATEKTRGEKRTVEKESTARVDKLFDGSREGERVKTLAASDVTSGPRACAHKHTARLHIAFFTRFFGGGGGSSPRVYSPIYARRYIVYIEIHIPANRGFS